MLGTLISNGVLWFPYTRLILTTFNTSLSEWVHAIFLTALAALVPQVILFIASCYLFDLGHNQNILACGVTTLIALASSYKYINRNHQFFIRVQKDSSKLWIDNAQSSPNSGESSMSFSRQTLRFVINRSLNFSNIFESLLNWYLLKLAIGVAVLNQRWVEASLPD